MSIFRGNDVRGVYGTELTAERARAIGNAFVRFLRCKNVVVGRDYRTSSPILSKEIIQGVREAGANVIDIGPIDSPGLYFASHYLQQPSIMVTASHNPPSHNGFYLCKKDAQPIYKENGLLEIEKLAERPINAKKQGAYKQMNIWNAYEKHVLSFANVKKIKPMKVVIDVGNGAGGPIVERIYKKIPQVKLVPLYSKPDGTFPNRGPDTSEPKNLKDLQKKVIETGADMGCAFDGDADRVAFVDERGMIVEGSIAGALLAHHLINNTRKKETIIYSIRSSRIVPELIKQNKGISIRERVGHSFMATHMRKRKALFGIENTGHYFYRDNFYTESAIITSLVMCSLLSKTHASLSYLVNPFKKYYMTEETSFSVNNQSNTLTTIENALRKEYRCPIDNFDGLSVDCGDFWFSVRASQTESKIRFVVEGKNKRTVENERLRLLRVIKKAVS